MPELKKQKDSDLLDIVEKDFEISRGHPQPLGATVMRNGINFALFSKNATDVTIVFFKADQKKPIAEFPLDPRYNRTGDIWHAFVKGFSLDIEYGYRVKGEADDKNSLHSFNPDCILLDPYAKAISGGEKWGAYHNLSSKNKPIREIRSMIIDDDYDWGFDQPLNIPLEETVIYELHVRGFTKHESSKVKHRGTYLGLIEKIPYLINLGITAVELLPINEFSELETNLINPDSGENLLNFWGYNSIGFFAPKASYAHINKNGAQVNEFKDMVKAFHNAGIEIILDVVFNHTAEGNEKGPTLSFKGLDNSIYYMLNQENGEYLNYSGCGNTLNCNHPVVRDMILDCLRYWVTEMHVDGFRFDLASILGRGQDGSVLANPPLLERIAADPILGSTKLIAEAWDAAGLYQVGTFPSWGRWAEWNAKFRDNVRRFVKGDSGMVPLIADSVIGSPDIYNHSGRSSHHSINFVTCHDGFTLNDMVSYNEKHNYANGENNRDGNNSNFSWNWGHEGKLETSKKLSSRKIKNIETLRLRQIKNMAALTLLSRGVPMILSGDEFRRTQNGNNNAYCQDNELSWLDWSLTEKNSDLINLFKHLIQFRKEHSTLFSDEILVPLKWHGTQPDKPDWSYHSRSLAWQYSINTNDKSCEIYIAANSFWEPLKFRLPELDTNQKWHRFLDTSLESPEDITETGKEFCLKIQKSYKIAPRSMIVLISYK